MPGASRPVYLLLLIEDIHLIPNKLHRVTTYITLLYHCFPKFNYPCPNFYAPMTFFSTSPYSCRFHCDLSPSLIGWEFITYKFVCSAGFRRREKDFCGLYLEIFLSIISRRCFAYFAVDRLFTRLSSVCKGILFSLFSVFCLNWSY